MVSPHKPLGEPIRRPEPALSLTPTTRGTRFWGVGMTGVCLLQPPQAQKPVQSLTKTQSFYTPLRIDSPQPAWWSGNFIHDELIILCSDERGLLRQ